MLVKLTGASNARIPRIPSGFTVLRRNQTLDITQDEYDALGVDLQNLLEVVDNLPGEGSVQRKLGDFSGSSGKTASWQNDAQTNVKHRGLHVIVNVTTAVAGGLLTPTIQGQGPFGDWYDLLVGAQIDGNNQGYSLMKMYPGISPLSGYAASDVLPPVWRISFVHANANVVRYTVGASLLV